MVCWWWLTNLTNYIYIYSPQYTLGSQLSLSLSLSLSLYIYIYIYVCVCVCSTLNWCHLTIMPVALRDRSVTPYLQNQPKGLISAGFISGFYLASYVYTIKSHVHRQTDQQIDRWENVHMDKNVTHGLIGCYMPQCLWLVSVNIYFR